MGLLPWGLSLEAQSLFLSFEFHCSEGFLKCGSTQYRCSASSSYFEFSHFIFFG